MPGIQYAAASRFTTPALEYCITRWSPSSGGALRRPGVADDDDRGGAKEYFMPEFRLTQISDTHLARRLPTLTDNFDCVREYIDARRPDLVINSGDVAFDGPTNRDDLEFAKAQHDAIPVPCRYLPGNHDIGDNPTKVGPPPAQPATEQHRQTFLSIFGEDRWRFDAAGWCFIGLNSLIMNTSLAAEAEQFDWLATQLSHADGKPVALFIHKPLYQHSPEDAELAATAIRYVPMPARIHLVEMLRAVDLRLVGSGHVHQRRDFTFGHIRHVWAPSAGFIPDRIQDVIGIKEVGLVEYRFQPDSFEVRYVRAPGQVDIGLDSLIGTANKEVLK
jgi:3',5'-cyclic AMP phosphodiesterase CpdA